MIVKITKKITIHSFIYFSIFFLNNYIHYLINYEYICYILSIIIFIIFSESHILNMDLKHLQDKYDKISNDYCKFIIETNKKNSTINEIIREHTSIIADVKKQMIEIKNDLYLMKYTSSSQKSISYSNKASPILKSIEASNHQIPKLYKRGLDSKSCVF